MKYYFSIFFSTCSESYRKIMILQKNKEIVLFLIRFVKSVKMLVHLRNHVFAIKMKILEK